MADQQRGQTPREEEQPYGPATHPQRLQRNIRARINTLRTTTEKLGLDHERTLSWDDLRGLLQDIKIFTEASHVTLKAAIGAERPTELKGLVEEIWEMVTDIKTDQTKHIATDTARKTPSSYAEALRGAPATNLQRTL